MIPSLRDRGTRCAAAVVVAALAACGAPLMKLPAGPGAPAPDAADALDASDRAPAARCPRSPRKSASADRSAASACAGGCSPASRRPRRRGSKRCAVRPAGLHLRRRAANDATLLLPRDDRVLEHGQPGAVLEAVAGVPLDAAGSVATLTGCAASGARADSGRAALGDDWRVVSDAGRRRCTCTATRARRRGGSSPPCHRTRTPRVARGVSRLRERAAAHHSARQHRYAPVRPAARPRSVTCCQVESKRRPRRPHVSRTAGQRPRSDARVSRLEALPHEAPARSSARQIRSDDEPRGGTLGADAATRQTLSLPGDAPAVRVRAFAKINLTLRVLGVRADGYHELRTTFQIDRAARHADVHAQRADRFGSPATIPAVPPTDTNLVWRAAERVWRAAGRRGAPGGVRARIDEAHSDRRPAWAAAAATRRRRCARWRRSGGVGARRRSSARASRPALGADVPYLSRGRHGARRRARRRAVPA